MNPAVLGLIDTALIFLTAIVVAEIVGAIVLFRLKMAWYSIGLTILLGLVFLVVGVVIQETQAIEFFRSKPAPATFCAFFIFYSLARLRRKSNARQIDDAFYKSAWSEIEDGTEDKGLWAKLYSQNAGDEALTKSKYVEQRARDIKRDHKERLRKRQQTREVIIVLAIIIVVATGFFLLS